MLSYELVKFYFTDKGNFSMHMDGLPSKPHADIGLICDSWSNYLLCTAFVYCILLIRSKCFLSMRLSSLVQDFDINRRKA